MDATDYTTRARAATFRERLGAASGNTRQLAPLTSREGEGRKQKNREGSELATLPVRTTRLLLHPVYSFVRS
jgi:hypothetical protein